MADKPTSLQSKSVRSSAAMATVPDRETETLEAITATMMMKIITMMDSLKYGLVGEVLENFTQSINEVINTMNTRRSEQGGLLADAEREQLERRLQILTRSMAAILAVSGMRDPQEISAYLLERNTLLDEEEARRLGGDAAQSIPYTGNQNIGDDDDDDES